MKTYRIEAISAMNDIINGFLLNNKIAVAGSFKNQEKYAYVILNELLRQGYEPVPVNPNYPEVEKLKCYKSVSDLPDEVLAVNIVTPPDITRRLVEECLHKGIQYVWLQPGAESDDAIEFCRKNGMKVIFDTCILTSLAE